MTNFLREGDVQGAVVVEESESESESVVVGDQEVEDVEEGASDAVVDGDGESAGTLIILLKSNCLLQSAGVFDPHSLSSGNPGNPPHRSSQ